MDMTQIAMQLRTQMLQQGMGSGEGQSGQVSESGLSFADLIMSMLSGSQNTGGMQGNELLGNALLNNMQSEVQTDQVMPEGEFLDIEAFASEYGGILNTIAKGILEDGSETGGFDFSMPVNNSVKEQIYSEKPVKMPEVQEKTEEPAGEMPAEKPVQALMTEAPEKAEESAGEMPAEKPVQTLMPEAPEKAEESAGEMPAEKPVQTLMPEATENTEESAAEKPVQMLMPEVPEKAEELISEVPEERPAEKPVQMLMPEVPEKTEEPVAEMPAEIPAEKPVQMLMPEVPEKAEEPVAEMPAERLAEKPVQMLMPEVPEKAEELIPEMPEERPAEKPVQMLMPEVPEKAEELISEMPEERPTEKPVQMLMPEAPVKAEELIPEMPEERPAEKPDMLFIPNVPEKTEEPIGEMPTEKPVQTLTPEVPEKAEEPVAEVTAERPAEKPVHVFMPETAEKTVDNKAHKEPVKLEIPLNKRNIDSLIKAGLLKNAKRTSNAEHVSAPKNSEENYFPVTAQNDSAEVYAEMMKHTNLFGMPGFGPGSSKEEVKLSDFSENVIKADPIQLSGLLGMVMTGSSVPVNNEILNTVYKETPFGAELNAAESISEKNTAAFDFVSKYIESGEVEILGYKPEETVQPDARTPEQQSKLQQTAGENSREVKPEDVQAEKSDRAVSSDVLNVYRTMRTANETMSAAKETIRSAVKNEKSESSEFEAIQRNMSELDIRFDRIDSEVKMNQRFEAPEQQIAKGVEENLKKGRSEFTVKLKPEGLGEIIVKLVKNDGGKMLMSMVASNVKTAELLNKNISALQSSLNAQNVEIINPKDMTKTVMPMTPAFEQYYSHQNGGGMYQQSQQQSQQQFSNRNYGMRTYNDVDDDEVFEAKAQSPVENDGLNIMI